MTIPEAIVIAIIEGITEFLPVSSTGHMIITQYALGIPADNFTKAFIVNIQFGAILAVVTLYFQRFIKDFQFYYKLITAFIPAAIFGLLLADLIDRLLESVLTVGITLLVGGFVLLYVDRWTASKAKNNEIGYMQSLIIGIFQCLAMIPGVSRSAATIIGALIQGIERKTAAEFSFFLAVPTMFAASSYKLLKNYETLSSSDINLLLIGNVVAYVVAMLAIRFFITYLARHGFKLFGYYRILLGSIILLLYFAGYSLSL